ncbi:MAG: electron transfer flavoprotein subunit alpha/FixB family protein [Nitrospinaceae bacterium]|jgi:electron transfer flavoprotein alpha subunit|nr:MAG: electron transfer flavoprotein subunit alpha/FixB family protein [Nitrospinaceae bacterium]
MDYSNDFVVIIDPQEHGVKPVSLEALFAARSLALAAAGSVTAVYPGNLPEDTGQTLIQHGADRVIVLKNEALTPYTVGAWLAALVPFLRFRAPQAVVLAATLHGKELAPALAASLDTGLATDCIALQMDSQLSVQRPVNAGKAIATLNFSADKPRIMTVRPNVFRGPGPDASRTGSVETLDINLEEPPLAMRVKEIVREAGDALDITEARVVVSGGLGMQGPANFHLLEELACVLGGTVGASRPVVDNGWRPYSNQVGQTGRTISPDLYIACGISGAVQHLAGMSSSKCIVAINKDPHAAIFSFADYGIVADVLTALPLLTEEFKRVLSVNV